MDTRPAEDERTLSVADFAREVGAHPNTVRKLIRQGSVPYLIEDLADGELVPPEAPRPARYRYLVPASAVQHAAALLNPSARSSQPPATSDTTAALQPPDTIAHRLSADVARLEAENRLLREHIAYLQSLTDRLLPLLPAAPVMVGTTEEPALEAPKRKRAWWRLWGR